MALTAEQRREERRRQILGTARAVFARKGYHATSVDDVIRETGVARGTFYNYFTSKRGVFAAVLDELFLAVSSAPQPIVVERGDVAGQVRANLRRVYAALFDHGDIARILLAEAVGLDAEADEDLRAFYSRVVARVEKALRTGQEAGIVRPGDPHLLACCLVGVIKEPVFQSMLSGRPLAADAVADEAFALLARGVVADGWR